MCFRDVLAATKVAVTTMTTLAAVRMPVPLLRSEELSSPCFVSVKEAWVENRLL